MSGPNPGNFNVTIRPDVWAEEAQRAITEQLAEMRNSLRAVEDGSFTTRAAEAGSGSVVRWDLDPQLLASVRTGEICNRAFLAAMRTLFEYLDRMIAVRRAMDQKVHVPRRLSSIEELAAFVREHVNGLYARVARDTRLTNPKKVEAFTGILPDVKRSALSMVALRRCMEHHGATPDSDLTVTMARLRLFAGDQDQEIMSLPFVAEEGTRIGIDMLYEDRVFPSGQRIMLTEEDVHRVFFTIQQLIIPEVRRVL